MDRTAIFHVVDFAAGIGIGGFLVFLRPPLFLGLAFAAFAILLVLAQARADQKIREAQRRERDNKQDSQA